MSTQMFGQRWGGWATFLLRLILTLLIWLPLPAGIYAAGRLLGIAREVPELPDLSLLEPTYATRIERLDGARLAGASVTRPVPFDDLPPHVVGAFLAAEDEDFFSHTAFNLRAILRAAMQNWQAGRTVQGGSTLSQQLAKQFMGNQKSYERKIRELLLARRLEATTPKPELLAIYLRTVFLGHTVYGVTQASWFYFGKDPRDLTLGEAATLAGMLPSPNRYDPLRHPKRSRAQRDRVLGRLHAIGALSEAQLALELERELSVSAPAASPDPNAVHTALTYLKQAEDLPESLWGEGAATLVMPHDPAAQADAQNALWDAVRAYDRRQGWRGPLARARDVQRVKEVLGALELRGFYTLGVVEEVHKDALVVWARGRAQRLPRARISWASSARQRRHYKRPVRLGDVSAVFEVGDVVALSGDGEAMELEQRALMDGAFHAYETLTGRVVASIGGVDPWHDEYHRAEQACRQPGSVFKPLVYGEAISRRISPATMVADVPIEIGSLEHGDLWVPRNADRNFKGYITLARSMASSRNVPTVALMERIGAPRIIKRARKLGISATLDPVPALALGASCVEPAEMIASYGAFQRAGVGVEVPRLDALVDGTGEFLRREGHFSAPFLALPERLTRMREQRITRERAWSTSVAYIMTWMLRMVATSGTAHDLPSSWRVAGKTGTTNAFDTWFIGFDGMLTAGVWVGSDKNTRSFGRGEHGATVAMPAFVDFYARRVLPQAPPVAGEGGEPERPWPGQPPEGVTFYPIDLVTGLLTQAGEPGTPYPFLKDTEPTEFAPTRAMRKAERIDELLLDY